MWLVTRYADVRRVLADRSFEKDIVKRLQSVTNQNLVRPERRVALPRRLRRGVIDRDGADHRRLRDLIKEDLRRAKVQELRPEIARAADRLLDDVAPGDEIDLLSRFARPLATDVIAELLGVPADERDGFPRWENAIFTGTSPEEIGEAGRQMQRFCRSMIELKRREPGDDVFTSLVRDERDGKLDEDELTSVFANLLIGGLETSTAIATAVAVLLTHPSQLAKLLADPSLLPSCVEEVLRYESTFRIMAPRFSEHELELDGITIPAGELVALSIAAANRDPRQYADADAFDVARHPRTHLGFGHGPHHCVGIALARLETAVALERFFVRYPGTRLAVPWSELPWSPGAYMRRLASLPVILGAAR